MLLYMYGENPFQSTPPAWEATNGQTYTALDLDVSIHAPRVGGDRLFPAE